MSTIKAAAVSIPELAEGEAYVGLLGDKEGNVHHVILLPGDNDDANWHTQLDWAKSIGGDLPTRLEQALLWANCRDQFQKDWYWSSEESGSGWAWSQYFGYGGQGYHHKTSEFRARAVRRLSI